MEGYGEVPGEEPLGDLDPCPIDEGENDEPIIPWNPPAADMA